jgi:alpha-glucuronidase
MPRYYHKADSCGVGFDRTRSGSGNVDQYHEPLASIYNDLSTCPEDLILWFHHVPWTHAMSSGRTLWEEICHRYDRGVKTVQEYQALWEEMKPYVDLARWEAVKAKLEIQESDARWWRDACVQYFGTFSAMPIPDDVAQPEMTIEEVKNKLAIFAAD